MRWKRKVFLMLGLVMGIFWGTRQREVTAFAAELMNLRQEIGKEAELQQDDVIADIDVTGIQEYLDQIGGDDTVGLTFRDLMDMIRKGDAESVFLYGKDRIVSAPVSYTHLTLPTNREV